MKNRDELAMKDENDDIIISGVASSLNSQAATAATARHPDKANENDESNRINNGNPLLFQNILTGLFQDEMAWRIRRGAAAIFTQTAARRRRRWRRRSSTAWWR